MSSDKKIPFSINDQEFDLTTYYGRFESFRKVSNPLHAFYPRSTIL